MEIKLIYFNQPFWRAEVARLSLFMSNIEFEDFRITDEDLRYLKANGKLKDGTSIPFRQLPVLVVDGHSIAQSGGIARICGKLSGMYSENIIPTDLPKSFERLTHLYNEISQQPKVQEWKKMTYSHEESATGEYNYHVPDKI